ncbi:ribulose-phosphate 3-epimerase [Conexivisphaera calida]|uniref:Ribulose-phosphate 3-epimerase n=1 Tax=Conexivisphaera calida TaxID=1874277 RepID=A0A4P2VDZ4_9ARCH|nr:ribulose-phosphate 3-epimerase [Conexivisphaera calida]BBE42774.1 Ribulose-phosphate 3-epimerase [Conexivisphaera calida]
MGSIRIHASLLGLGVTQLPEALRGAEAAGVDAIHFDISDGCFTENLTYGPWLPADLRGLSRLEFEAHLMVVHPGAYYGELSRSVSRVYFHAEAVEDPRREAAAIRDLGVSPGLALSPGTTVASISGHLDSVDSVLVMLVRPGRGGQTMDASLLDKVSELSAIRERKEMEFSIAVDGGVKPGNARLAASRGADVLISGTGIFAGDPSAAVEEFRRSVRIGGV